MRRLVIVFIVGLTVAAPAAAQDLPPRKPGLWELRMEFDGGRLPGQTMRQCVDAESDKLMNMNFAGSNREACSKLEVKRDGGAIVIDSVCKFGEQTVTSHSVMTGSFDSAYAVRVTSKREGGPPLPGVAPGAETVMTIAATWRGACAAGQRPGDVVMSNGATMNVFDLQRARDAAPR
ncbi:MAG: DUF3617 domain-containing protein [Pseudolabrys sp.]